MIVATAGHIDHGKTTLVRALTGVDTDRLPEEKARGISIDLGFAHRELPGGGTLAFVDVPGHERFVRNMLSGVYAVDHVLLVVAADDGVMPQTREHLAIVELLGVAEGTVVITKGDRVPAARVEAVAQEVRRLLQSGPLRDAPVLPVSAVTGAGMDSLLARLEAAAAAARAARAARDQPARFVVDRVFTLHGSGTVVTGTVIAGAIAEGDSLAISPAGTPARVRGLQRHGRAVARAEAGDRCAINVAVKREEVARGDWLVAPVAHRPTARIDIRLTLLPTEASALKHWTPVHLHIGAADVPARVAIRRGVSVAPGETVHAHLRLERPIHAAHGDRLILRDQAASRTIAGGVVLDPFPAAGLSHERRAEVLEALSLPRPADALRELLARSARGVSLDRFERVFNWPARRADALLPAGAVVLEGDARLAFDAAHVDALHERIVSRLRAFHDAQPAASGCEIAQLRESIECGIAGGDFAQLVRVLAARGRIEVRGSQARLAGRSAAENPRDVLAWQRIQPLLQDAAATIPSVRELAGITKLPLQQVRDLLHRKSAAGALVKLTPERFALPGTMAMLAARAKATAQRQPQGLFTAAQYRDAIGTGRGLAIEILECMDRRGATRRRGENTREWAGGDADPGTFFRNG
jgi:selenocysteine-specific elongation factor